jgi:hypothetical protein
VKAQNEIIIQEGQEGPQSLTLGYDLDIFGQYLTKYFHQNLPNENHIRNMTHCNVVVF